MEHFILLAGATFAGAVASGLAGFAFSAAVFPIGFGVFLAGSPAYMLFRRGLVALERMTAAAYEAAVGFAGGLIGRVTTMPGAAPVVWCDRQELPKEQQRGIVQPFVAVMQIASVLMLVGTGRLPLPMAFLPDLGVAAPAVAAGTAFGIYMFGKVDEVNFRRIVLGARLISGISFLTSEVSVFQPALT
jgi:hypothetical protein